MKVPVSILIPIKNEAVNLPRCLPSVAWADEILVVDSGSTDGSAALAEAAGARVVQFHFTGDWPKKKNWALDHLPFRHEWVFILDADEVLPPGAEEEIREMVTGKGGDCVGYWINRRFMFMGRWLRHAYYPNWNLRLFKHRLGRYEKLVEGDTGSGDNEVHEHVVLEGRAGFLQCEMDHYAFPSVDVFVEKHNRYSNWEARVALRGSIGGDATDPGRPARVGWRRRCKRLSHHLPFRPLLRFLYVYFWQGGMLDGREGFYFARLHAFYEFLSVAKTYELKKKEDAAAKVLPAGLGGWVRMVFLISLGVVIFYALRPSLHGERTQGIPHALAFWINLHDGGSNVLAFAALASLGFWSSELRHGPALESRGAKDLAARNQGGWRLVGLLSLVVLLEVAQIWIPGRVSDAKDVAAGWVGVLLAWCLWRLGVRRLGSAGKGAAGADTGPEDGRSCGRPGSGLRLTVWGINYAPEPTGIAPYNTALCEYLRGCGHEVRMVTTFTYYPAWRKLPSERFRLFRTDEVEGVRVHRCWHYVPAKVTTLRRIVHEGSFVLTSLVRQMVLPRPDVLIVVSPPLFLGAAAWLLGKLKRAPFVFHVQDLQPGAAAELGMLKNRWLIRGLYGLEAFAYARAAWVSGLTPGMLAAFARKGVEQSRLVYFPNGVTLPDRSRRPVRGGFRAAEGYAEDDFLVVYSGNLGVKQGLEALIEAARLVRDPRVRFVICGEGSQRERLLDLLARDPVAKVRLLPLQPERRYHEMLVDADLCVIPQQRGSGDCFFPSKLLLALAFGKAVLAVAADGSELVRALEEGRFGAKVDPGQSQECAALIERLAAERACLPAWGEAGRKYVEQFESDGVLGRFEFALRQLAARRAEISQPSSVEKPFARPFAS